MGPTAAALGRITPWIPGACAVQDDPEPPRTTQYTQCSTSPGALSPEPWDSRLDRRPGWRAPHSYGGGAGIVRPVRPVRPTDQPCERNTNGCGRLARLTRSSNPDASFCDLGLRCSIFLLSVAGLGKLTHHYIVELTSSAHGYTTAREEHPAALHGTIALRPITT